MSEYGFIWIAIVGASFVAATLGSYLAYRFQMAYTNRHISLLERELSLSRIREERNERRLVEISEAMTSLQQSTESQLLSLKTRVNELITNLKFCANPTGSEPQKICIELV
jgi:hypothetical protein